jgi:hypothetical protein
MGSPFTRDTYTHTKYTTRAEALPERLGVRAKAAAADAVASVRIDRVCAYIYTPTIHPVAHTTPNPEIGQTGTNLRLSLNQ